MSNGKRSCRICMLYLHSVPNTLCNMCHSEKKYQAKLVLFYWKIKSIPAFQLLSRRLQLTNNALGFVWRMYCKPAHSGVNNIFQLTAIHSHSVKNNIKVFCQALYEVLSRFFTLGQIYGPAFLFDPNIILFHESCLIISEFQLTIWLWTLTENN